MRVQAGLRLQSAACDTEVIVTRAGSVDGTLTCGGRPMVELGGNGEGQDRAEDGDGTLLGKRYVDDLTGLEVLCTKPGHGSLKYDGRNLVIKGTKPLPSSD